MAMLQPEQIGKYEVIRKLGEGATSEVFLCHDSFNSRDVAVKVVFEDKLQEGDDGRLARKLFLTEAALAGKLLHPHIAQIHDAVVGDNNMSYIVMEYVAGGTLEPYCDKTRLLPIDKIVVHSQNPVGARNLHRMACALTEDVTIAAALPILA